MTDWRIVTYASRTRLQAFREARFARDFAGPQRAAAAFLASALRSSAVSIAKPFGTRFFPPRLPSATAAAFFRLAIEATVAYRKRLIQGFLTCDKRLTYYFRCPIHS